MSMSVGSESGTDDVMVEMNTTPLIDVMLVLLVMLIITIPIQTHAVKLDLPINNTPPPQDVMPEVINLEIDFDGTPIWNGTPVSSMAQLDRYFQESAAKPVQTGSSLETQPLGQIRCGRQDVGSCAASRRDQDRICRQRTYVE